MGQKVQGIGLGGPFAGCHIPKPCQGDLPRQQAIYSRSCCSSSLNQTHPLCFFLGVTEAQHQQHPRHQWVPAAACRLEAAVPTSCALEQSTLSPALGTTSHSEVTDLCVPTVGHPVPRAGGNARKGSCSCSPQGCVTGCWWPPSLLHTVATCMTAVVAVVCPPAVAGACPPALLLA